MAKLVRKDPRATPDPLVPLALTATTVLTELKAPLVPLDPLALTDATALMVRQGLKVPKVPLDPPVPTKWVRPLCGLETPAQGTT